MPQSVRQIIKPLGILLVVASLCACATLNPGKYAHKDTHQKLMRNIELYNHDFETKSFNSARLLVKDAHREEFLTKLIEVQQRVMFEKSTMLNMRFSKDGQAIRQSYMMPEEDFNEAVVTYQYQVVVSPSAKLQTLLVQQRWELQGNNLDWVVVPNLDDFLAPPAKK